MTRAQLRASMAFGGASLLPVPLLLAAALWGGAWPWIALLYLTLFAFAMDELIGISAAPGVAFPLAERLSAALGLAHFAVLGAVIWRFGQAGASLLETAALFMAAGLFLGQIGTANAHELIHRPARGLRRLGRWVFASLLFGHHASAHPLVHHVYVASPRDPNSPRRGEGYYRFLLRAWAGSWRAGYQAEAARLTRAQPGRWHPYWGDLALSAGALFLAYALGGGPGLALYGALCLFAQSQLLMSDYVQHYGLERHTRDGKLEPVGPQHSWNAPHLFTSHMMLNAPRHSAHHARPDLRFDALELPGPDEAPMLPRSLPAMSCLALIPPLWRRVMDPRVAHWRRVAEARAEQPDVDLHPGHVPNANAA